MGRNVILKMIDGKDEEIKQLVEDNKYLFKRLLGDDKKCYVANKINKSEAKGYFSYIDFKESYGEQIAKVYITHDFDDMMAIPLICDISEACAEEIENEFTEDEDVIEFKLLNDKRNEAFLGLLNMDDDTQKAFIGIKKDIGLPFITGYPKDGVINYEVAAKEEGTVPYMVENNKFVDLLPEYIKSMLGISLTVEDQVTDLAEKHYNGEIQSDEVDKKLQSIIDTAANIEEVYKLEKTITKQVKEVKEEMAKRDELENAKKMAKLKIDEIVFG